MVGLDDIALLSAVGVSGLVSVIVGITKTYFSRKAEHHIKIQMGDGKILEIDRSRTSNDEIEKLLDLLAETESPKEKKSTFTSKESGGVLSEVLLLIIPGIIALMLAGTFIYLLIANQSIPNYSTPKELGGAMTTIMGYYFGLGASSVANKSEVLTHEQVKKLING